MEIMMDNMGTTLVGGDDTSLLKNHNIRVYYDLKKELLEKKHVLLETCPGSGKSYVSAQIIKNMNWNALVVVTTNAILYQWEDLFDEYGMSANIKTYSSIAYMELESVIDYVKDIDVIILDEAHHILADKWSENLLYIRDVLDKYMLGLTADCIRWSDRFRDVSYEFFKSKVIGYSLDEFYDIGLAEPFTYVCGVYDKETLKKSFEENFNNVKDNQLIGKLLNSIDNIEEVGSILVKYSDKFPMQKIIVFVETAEDLKSAQDYLKVLNVKCLMVHSKFGKKYNSDVLSEFKSCNYRCALFCINMLNEGVHINGIDTVMMLRRTFTPNMYIQQIGRIVSVGASKNTVVFDFVCNYVNVSSLHNFNFSVGDGKSTINVKLKALSDQIIIDDYLIRTAEILIKLYEIRTRLRYDDAEDNIIKEYYERYGAAYCVALLPGRDAQSITCRANALGLYRNPYPEEVDAVIKEHWHKANRKEILKVKLPELSYTQVYSRAHVLNLPMERADAWLIKEDNLIKEKFNSNSTSEIRDMLNSLECNIVRGIKRTLTAVYQRQTVLGLTRVVKFSEDDVSIIKTYYPLVGTRCKLLLNEERTCAAIRSFVRTIGIKFIGTTMGDISSDKIISAYNKFGKDFDSYPNELRIFADRDLYKKLQEVGLIPRKPRKQNKE